MSVKVRAARSAREKRIFIHLPERLYEKRFENWVHPIYVIEKDLLNPAKNDAWGFCEGEFLIAWQEDDPVGRILVFINHKVNRLRGERHARFGFFDCEDNQEVASSLLKAAEEWAKSKGCECIVGPLGFTDMDAEGMLVEGFDEQTSISTWWHPPYTFNLVEGAGYKKEIDWVTYLVDLSRPLPEVYNKVADRLKFRSKYKLHQFTRRKDLWPFAVPVFRLINETYVDLYGFSPLTEEEIHKIAREYIPLLDPRFVKIVTLNGDVKSFVIGIPDMTPGIRKARGRLFPFGFLHIQSSAKHSKRLDMLLGAVAEDHRGKGLDMLMAVAFHESAVQSGFTHADSHHELETNTRVRGEMEKLGGKLYKRYRIYRKNL
ncbi:hypothetical protein JXM67_00060 [candidate division WOR-3 bacterium]|nr:hypothetical protein [candidate division WOR-3 bacterium]